MAAETIVESATQKTEGSGQFSSEMMEGVFARFGKKLPTVEKKDDKDRAAAQAAAGEEEGAETQERAVRSETDRVDKTRKEGESEQSQERTLKDGDEGDERQAKGEGEDAGEQGEEAEHVETDENSEETTKIVSSRLKDLPAAQRKTVEAVIGERIAKISARKQADVDRLKTRVVELNDELVTARKGGGSKVALQNVHPTMLVETAEELNAYADTLEEHESMLEAVRDTGVEADAEKGQPGYTAEQIRARLRDIRKERERILPAARDLLAKRQADAASVKAALPTLFDPTTDEYRQADKLRRQLPELRRHPDAETIIAKIVLGTIALEGLTKENGRRAPVRKTTSEVRQTTVTTRKAPRAPGRGSAALGSVLDDPRQQQSDASGAVKTFMKTRNRSDLVSAVRAIAFTQ